MYRRRELASFPHLAIPTSSYLYRRDNRRPRQRLYSFFVVTDENERRPALAIRARPLDHNFRGAIRPDCYRFRACCRPVRAPPPSPPALRTFPNRSILREYACRNSFFTSTNVYRPFSGLSLSCLLNAAVIRKFMKRIRRVVFSLPTFPTTRLPPPSFSRNSHRYPFQLNVRDSVKSYLFSSFTRTSILAEFLRKPQTVRERYYDAGKRREKVAGFRKMCYAHKAFLPPRGILNYVLSFVQRSPQLSRWHALSAGPVPIIFTILTSYKHSPVPVPFF